jgi:hypothetical protein
MSPRYGIPVVQQGGYSLELTDRGETIVYRSSDLIADAGVGWTDEDGSLHAHLHASSLRRRDNPDPLPPDLAETLLERMASFLGDGDLSRVSIDRSPRRSIADVMAEYIARAEASGQWKGERRSDGTWVLRRTRTPGTSN